MRVFLLNPVPALENIERQVRKFRSSGASPPTFPVFASEFRRAVAQIEKMRPTQRRKYGVDGDSFVLKIDRATVEIIPAKGPFYWRAGVWCHHSIAWEIRKDGKPVNVMRDTEDYMPVAADVDGKRRPIIGGRRAHREFLKRNRYVELGNELPKDGRTFDMPSVKEDLQRAMATGMTPEMREAARRAQDAVKE